MGGRGHSTYRVEARARFRQPDRSGRTIGAPDDAPTVSQHTLPGARHARLLMPMRGRDPAEDARSSTPLELFFDLVFVVAVALAAERLHHALLEGDPLRAILQCSTRCR
jgi:hypothetical protein